MSSNAVNLDTASSPLEISVPVYNEGENVMKLYQGLVEAGVSFSSLKFVYDFDEDSTLPYIGELAAKDQRVIAEKNNYGRGVLNALKWAFAKSGDGAILVLMGDCSDKLTIVNDMVECWEQGACLVSPSRYMKGGAQHGGGVIKSTLSRLAGKSLYFFGLPTSDPTNNFKLYDGKWLSSVKIESSQGFEIALELCFKAMRDNKKIVQLPTEWFDRTNGESQFKLLQWLPSYLYWYFRTLFQLFIKRVK